jgi:hypothetical protein
MEKELHTSGASGAAFARTNTDAVLKPHTAPATDDTSAASKAQRPTGASYDEYRRAYSHGATLGRDERYRGADWQGVEPSARANWESRYPESGWERFKTAVRHGWERVTRGG